MTEGPRPSRPRARRRCSRLGPGRPAAQGLAADSAAGTGLNHAVAKRLDGPRWVKPERAPMDRDDRSGAVGERWCEAATTGEGIGLGSDR
jgi:hypothetical protein